MKLKKGIDANLGSRTPSFAASIGSAVMEPPYVVESRNFIKTGLHCYTDDFAFVQPAKAMAKVFKTLGLPFHHGMPKQMVEDYMRAQFDEVSYGPDRPYRSPFTSDPNDWSRGYTPQPGDVSSSIVGYHDGLLYTLSFWRQELTGIDVMDVEIVAMNNLEQEPLPEIDLTRPPRSFEAALELLHMKDSLRYWRERKNK